MVVFEELINNITNNINSSIETNSGSPVIFTALCIKETGSTRRELRRLYSQMVSPNGLTPQIEDLINYTSNRNEIIDIFKQFNPKFNRIYGKTFLEKEPEIEQFKETAFKKPLIYSGHPYYCPNGWRRYSLLIDNFKFNKDWPVAYHGTASKNLINILHEGLRPSEQKKGKHCAVFGDGFYFSPSIEYAEIKKSKTKGFYIQTVLQCRVKPETFKIRRETLLSDKSKQIDPNFKNSELEWLIPKDYITLLNISKSLNNSSKNDERFFIISGIMARLTKEDPKDLKMNFKNRYQIFDVLKYFSQINAITR
ncbi:hypothetical protein BpHYR1_020433 [Brachionus plicatilis]|uniref:PARP catalytic domain-containing protein n=1 Tax=Brachionus plicatilis TaxID=10195 RepID=A0A3M7RFL5_BRAPC|nr:hypothetical protein BpHYR1_020433 [Brachionus plicatilis]